MSYRVLTSARADAEVMTADTWWRLNRLAAPGLFLAELRTALSSLSTRPHTGVLVQSRRHTVRSMLMPKTGYRVFYRVDKQAAEVRVLTVWSALRGKQPRF